jgi:Bardet-Biedl syndrome 1 protein
MFISDGENKLIICNQDKRMLIYRGTTLSHEVILLDTPIAVCITYTDNTPVN